MLLVLPSYLTYLPSDRVRAISIAMGLQPVMWTRISPLATFDTGGAYQDKSSTPSFSDM